jgi:cytochrome P450
MSTALSAIPGDRGLPLIGYSLTMLRDPLGFARWRYERFGPVSWTSGFGIRIVGAVGPDAAESVLVNRDKAFSNGHGWEYFIGPFFRRGIMLLDFDEHLHHRRIMQQAFTRDRLRSYLDTMNPSIERGIAAWLADGRVRGGFKVLPANKQLTLDLATRTFVGGELGPEADRVNRAFFDTVRAALALLRFNVPGGRWSRGLRGRRLLERFFAERLAAKRAGDGPDLFTALCHAVTDDGHQFSDDDVINHMIFLLMAAHDTTTITMTSMTYLLAKHPEWQDRLREESLALGKPALGFDDLDRLPSMDLVMKEALRLIPPVPAVPRKTVKETELLGYVLPPDTSISVSILFNHHLETLWPDPERFDPERFAPHRREDRVHSYAWTPFGGGVHKCIGLKFAAVEVKAIMHQVLLRYRWSIPDGYRMPIDWTSLPIPSDGLPVQLELR